MKFNIGDRASAPHSCMHGWRGIPVLLAVLLALVTPRLYADATLTVRVFERGGAEPLAGVAVCLGTPARIAQFGSTMTSSDGYARFPDVPRAPLVVTASRPGYKGEQQSLVTSNTGRMLVISLPPGGGGPLCEGEGQSAAAFSGGLNIGYFRLIDRSGSTGEHRVALSHSVNREPTHYRVSEDPDFRGAQWQPYTPGPVYQLSRGAGYKVVYFQVRRLSSMGGGEVETLSPVMQDVILVQ